MPMPQVVNPYDQDDKLVAIFKQIGVPNPGKSKLAGRPIFDDMDVCEIRRPGSRDVSVFPAHAFARWIVDPLSGEQISQTYAERFPRQFRQFAEKSTQTMAGTPLDYAAFLTEARRSELRALNIYTIEALAHVDGQELKNLGPQGREIKNKAVEYLAESGTEAHARKLEIELEAARARNQVLEDDLTRLKAVKASKAEAAESAEDIFDDMTLTQLRDYIAANTGHPPQGNINRKTLVRMAEACKPKAA